MRAVLPLGAAVMLAFAHHTAFGRSESLIPNTPVGITESPSQSIVVKFVRHRTPRSLADAMGMALYTYDPDTKDGKSTCVADCATAWPPLLAPADAAVTPEWSVVARPNGTKQWTYRGKPLYRCSKDTKAGETAGDGADGKWHLAVYEIPTTTVSPPAKISVNANATAGGDVFVDYRGHTIYVMADSRSECRNDCMRGWSPLAAAQLAIGSRDWTITVRDGDLRQWAYKGQPVYTFDGDVKPGDANGVFGNKAWRAAILRSYPTPPQVRTSRVGSVTIWTTADGMTLYARDRYQYVPGSFNADDGSTSTVVTGREIGTQACEGGCPEYWKPFEAVAGAQASGYWSILTRPEGTKQWAYQGYALYTNAHDKKPGEMMGHDVFELLDGTDAMYWRAAVP
jgi:predicted lipoprotein with Yx(FWY)xxD motif